MVGLVKCVGRWQVLLLTAVLSFAGCGGGAGDAPTVYPVTGKVTKGGTALANITVNFVPIDDAGLPSSGVTDEEGVYSLSRHTGDAGAMPGAYKVVLVDNDAQMSAEDYSSASGGGPPKAKDSRVPAKWGAKDDTPKTAQVEEKENTINIDVTE
jgi:hypothetical protein